MCYSINYFELCVILLNKVSEWIKLRFSFAKTQLTDLKFPFINSTYRVLQTSAAGYSFLNEKHNFQKRFSEFLFSVNLIVYLSKMKIHN